MNYDIGIEMLIALVENKPVHWDKKDRKLRK